jgi:hypothetical protein
MNISLSWLASIAASVLASWTNPATLDSLQTPPVAKIANYKQWTKVTPHLPPDLRALNAQSVGG